MIAKKNPKVNLEGKRAAIFNVGLLVAGSFTLAAFTYSEPTIVEAEKQAVPIEEIVTFDVEEKEPEPEMEREEQPQNQTEQQQQEEQNMGSQTGLAENVSATENGKEGVKTPDGPGAFGFSSPYKKKKISHEDDIKIPLKDATYDGGILEMKKKIASVQQYPDIDRELGNQGIVYVSFVVEKDGSITNVKTERGVTETLDREAVRIIKTFPKWIPGEDEYGVVRTRVRMPIKFVLQP